MTKGTLIITDKPIKIPGSSDQSTTAKGAKGLTKGQMLERFKKVRQETTDAFALFSDEDLTKMGAHKWFPASPRPLALCISGHQSHHFGVIGKNYL